MSNVLDQALTDDLITSNPLDRVIIAKVASKNTKDSDYEPDPFDKLEIEAILANAEGQAKNRFNLFLHKTSHVKVDCLRVG